MNDKTFALQRLDWDSDFFGFEIAEATGMTDPQLDFPRIRPGMRDAGIRLCYASWPRSGGDETLAAERSGGRHINSRITFRRTLESKGGRNLACDLLDTPSETDRGDLADLAVVAGEYSRFRVDTRFPRNGFHRLYHRWMANSIAGDMADDIAIFRIDGRIRGMVTLQKKNATGIIGLIAVADGYRGRSIGSSLMATALHWFSTNGCSIAEVVTQGENTPAMSLYATAGYQIAADDDIYHFWED